MPDLTVAPGLPERFRAEAARLYLAAFWPKLDRVLGAPNFDAVARIGAARLRPDRCISALRDDACLGVAGFKRDGEGFLDITLADLQRLYGRWGGLWRGLVLTLIERDERQGELLMDGICVAAEARGRGIGTRLLDAVEAEARRTGATAIRLDVIDTNPRARALYERRGYRATRTHRLGPLRHVFGFAEATEMAKTIGDAA